MEKIVSRLRLRHMTIRQSFAFVICVALLAVLVAIMLEFDWAERARRHFADRPAADEWVLFSLVAAILLTVGAAIVAMGSLFYKLKIKKPLELLMQASAKIAANDLGFHIRYESGDELGELCRAFEKMRSQLESSYMTLWRSGEERKRLNTIFAHDLRTPLSVLKGYSEFLTSYVPQGAISPEKLLDTIRTMETHILRLERYVEAMNSIQKLEDMPVDRRETGPDTLISLLDDSARHIAERHGKAFGSHKEADSAANLSVDGHLVMQVFENIAANAVRYASSRVDALYTVRDGVLSVTVVDDGPGFAAGELTKAALPFYRGAVPDGHAHYGLGLYICKALCEKHGGSLHVANEATGGGKVTASFACGVDK